MYDPRMSLFGELKRRNVFRVAIAYLITAWLLIQLADMAVGAIHRKYRQDRANRLRWYEMLRPRIQDVWTFPNPGH